MSRRGAEGPFHGRKQPWSAAERGLDSDFPRDCARIDQPWGRTAREPTPVAEAGEPLPVEAACGQCRFGMPGDDCELAVRIHGQVDFVDGTGIDDHGDAHAWDGFCNAVRPTRVAGRIENGRFVTTSFEWIDESVED